MVKNKFCIFSGFTDLTIRHHSDVTRKSILLIFDDMDKGDQGLYVGTKYNTIGPLL